MKKHFELIQAIRGLAAAMVVFFHTNHVLGVGAFGVDVFFVLSGGIMAMLMQAEKLPGVFMKRRLIRIMPLYFIMTTAATVISWKWPELRSVGNAPTFGDYAASIFFVPARTVGVGITPILNPGWTLNCEMLFYICCAFALLIYSRQASILVATAVAGWCAMAHWIFPGTTFGEFYSNPIFIEFVFGLSIWHLYKRYPCELTSRKWIAVVAIVFGAMVVFERFVPIKSAIPAEWSRPLVYGTMASVAIYLGFSASQAFEKIPSLIRRTLLLVGDASYAIYLTHVFVIGIMKQALPLFCLGPVSSTQGALLTVLAAIVVGVAVDKLIDAPLQRKLRSALAPQHRPAQDSAIK